MCDYLNKDAILSVNKNTIGAHPLVVYCTSYPSSMHLIIMDTVTSSPSAATQPTADAKIMADLNTLQEKLDLCHSMLHPGDGSPSPSLKNNDVLLAVIGFLEACAPRMVELVEAAAQGALSEDVLCSCLSVNDTLLKQLSDIETYSFTETTASTTAAAAPNPTLEDQLDELFLDDSNTNEVDPFAEMIHGKKGKSTGIDDPFGDDLLGLSVSSVEDGKMPATNLKSAPPANAKVGDDIPDFLSG